MVGDLLGCILLVPYCVLVFPNFGYEIFNYTCIVFSASFFCFFFLHLLFFCYVTVAGVCICSSSKFIGLLQMSILFHASCFIILFFLGLRNELVFPLELFSSFDFCFEDSLLLFLSFSRFLLVWTIFWLFFYLGMWSLLLV